MLKQWPELSQGSQCVLLTGSTKQTKIGFDFFIDDRLVNITTLNNSTSSLATILDILLIIHICGDINVLNYKVTQVNMECNNLRSRKGGERYSPKRYHPPTIKYIHQWKSANCQIDQYRLSQRILKCERKFINLILYIYTTLSNILIYNNCMH